MPLNQRTSRNSRRPEAIEIIRWLERSGLIQKEIADLAGVSAVHIHCILQDEREPSRALVERLERARRERWNYLRELLGEHRTLSADAKEAWRLVSTNQYDTAVRFCLEKLSKNQNDAALWVYLGLAYQEGCGSMTKAYEAYQQAVRIDPNYAEAWYRLDLASGAKPAPRVYVETASALIESARLALRATNCQSLIALRAVVGSTFFNHFRDDLVKALRRGATVRITFCDFRNLPALEQRSRQLVGDLSHVQNLKRELLNSSRVVLGIATEAQRLRGTLDLRTYGSPVAITCAQTVIIPNYDPRRERFLAGRSRTAAILWHVPYGERDIPGRRSMVYEHSSTVFNLKRCRTARNAFSHYYSSYLDVWSQSRPFKKADVEELRQQLNTADLK